MKRWLKLDENFPFGHTTTLIQEKFGHEGLLVWLCMLTAAKRGTPEGSFSYTPGGFWARLGLSDSEHELKIDPDTFITYTGQLKQTRIRRSGHVKHVSITRWGEWQDDWRRDSERERKSRYRQQVERDRMRTGNGHGSGQDADREGEQEEKEREIKAKANGLPVDKELATTALLEAIGLHDQSTAVVVRRFSSRLPVGAIHKVLESLETNDPRNRAAYVVGSLKSEIAERGDGNAA